MDDNTIMQTIGVIIALAGLALRYGMNRRQFNRRNHAGIQIFKSYEHRTATIWLERLGRLVGFALIVLGIVLWFLAWNSKQYLKKHHIDKYRTEQGQ